MLLCITDMRVAFGKKILKAGKEISGKVSHQHQGHCKPTHPEKITGFCAFLRQSETRVGIKMSIFLKPPIWPIPHFQKQYFQLWKNQKSIKKWKTLIPVINQIVSVVRSQKNRSYNTLLKNLRKPTTNLIYAFPPLLPFRGLLLFWSHFTINILLIFVLKKKRRGNRCKADKQV